MSDHYSPEFKAKLVLDAIGKKDGVNQVSAEYNIPIELLREWHDYFTDHACDIFLEQLENYPWKNSPATQN